MNRFDRVTSILVQLQSRKVVKAREMAERFDVSLRTIYRDIRSLEEAGIPLYGEAGMGHSLSEGYRLPPVMFTREETIAFLTAEKLVEKLTDVGTSKNYQEAMYNQSDFKRKRKGLFRRNGRADFRPTKDQPIARKRRYKAFAGHSPGHCP